MSDDTPTHKRCTKCEEMKPLEAFGKQKYGKYGKRSVCKACRKAYRADNAEYIREAERVWRAANAEKLKEYFRAHYAANTKAYNEKNREYRTANAEKINAQRREYRTANADRLREKRAANSEQHRQASKAWHAANVEQQREYRRWYYAPDRQRARRAANPDLYRAIGNRYQARKKSNGGHFTAQQIRDMRTAQAGICVYCNRQYDLNHLQIEHIIPVCQGGSSDISNICLACVKCNCSKKGRTPEQWVNRWYERDDRTNEE
jgi:5-methylcytosine-specific restriction endonuclease McrA